MKACSVCHESKPETEFQFARTRGGARRERCNDCLSRDRRESGQVRRRNMRWRWGLDPEDFDGLIRRQAGLCLICEMFLGETTKSIHVDHDHLCCPSDRTKKTCGLCVRGLLCSTCNLSLGAFEATRALHPAFETYLAAA